MGERGVIAETQACRDDPFLHGCTYSALSVDERASAEERAPEGQTVAVGEGGEASEYAWLLPLLCDGLVGAIMLGVLLRLLSRCHNGVCATLRRPWFDVAEEIAGILSRLSAGDVLCLVCLALLIYELRPGVLYFGLGLVTTVRVDRHVGDWIAAPKARPAITPHGTMRDQGVGPGVGVASERSEVSATAPVATETAQVQRYSAAVAAAAAMSRAERAQRPARRTGASSNRGRAGTPSPPAPSPSRPSTRSSSRRTTRSSGRR